MQFIAFGSFAVCSCFRVSGSRQMDKDSPPSAAINQRQQTAVNDSRKFSISNVLARLLHFIGELNKRGSIHGVDHFVNVQYHPLERLLWFICVMVSCYGVYFFCGTQMERYIANPTVISLERGESFSINFSHFSFR